jgi:hypothetical protein
MAQWTIVLTNVPASMLTIEQAFALLRARWQIELLFKLWKQEGLLDQWNGTKPWRVLCEVYAKLLAMVVQHWFVLHTSSEKGPPPPAQGRDYPTWAMG